jgi:hypothetical protein
LTGNPVVGRPPGSGIVEPRQEEHARLADRVGLGRRLGRAVPVAEAADGGVAGPAAVVDVEYEVSATVVLEGALRPANRAQVVSRIGRRGPARCASRRLGGRYRKIGGGRYKDHTQQEMSHE